jgi:hypothetical protein
MNRKEEPLCLKVHFWREKGVYDEKTQLNLAKNMKIMMALPQSSQDEPVLPQSGGVECVDVPCPPGWP